MYTQNAGSDTFSSAQECALGVQLFHMQRRDSDTAFRDKTLLLY